MNHWISAKTTETETIKRTWPPGYPGQEPATQPVGKVAQAAHGGGQHQGGGRHPGGQEFMTFYQKLTLLLPETKYFDTSILNFFSPGSCCHFQHWLHSALLPTHHPRRLPHLSRGCLLLSSHPTRSSPSLKLGLLLFWPPHHVPGCPAPTPHLLSPVKQAISIF